MVVMDSSTKGWMDPVESEGTAKKCKTATCESRTVSRLPLSQAPDYSLNECGAQRQRHLARGYERARSRFWNMEMNERFRAYERFSAS